MIPINEIKDTTVLIIGDCMIDRYWWGDVERISPEAPVPVVQLRRTSIVAGGAANVAANIAGLGATPILIGVCGADGEADVLRDAIEKSGVLSDHLIQVSDRPTTTKTRVVAHGQHVVRIDQESAADIDRETEDDLIEGIAESIPNADAVVLSDYAKGVLTDRIIRSTIELATDKGIRCFVDPKGSDYSKYRGASVITPNRHEAAIACGLSLSDREFVNVAGLTLLDQVRCEAVLITEGEHGMTLFVTGKKSVHLDSSAREVFDVTGAGDTVIATFATAAAAGYDLENAANLANLAAGIVVGTIGTTTITSSALAAAYSNSEEK